MPKSDDYYRILQVDPSDEPEVIRAAYRRLSLECHPDRNKSPDATRLMQELNKAYAVLGDEKGDAALFGAQKGGVAPVATFQRPFGAEGHRRLAANGSFDAE